MTLSSSAYLGIAFCVVALVGAVLQYWLWTFPMAPDPGGSDPNGVTTAPKTWRIVHRLLGYSFAVIYVVLLIQMLPRLPFVIEESESVFTWVHVVGGFVIGPVLLIKIFVLRWAQRFGKMLPTLGSLLLGLAFLVVGLAAPGAARLQTLPAETEADLEARSVVLSRCLSCHGATPILDWDDDDPWHEILEEMSEIAEKQGKPDPVGDDGELLEAYLDKVLPRKRD